MIRKGMQLGVSQVEVVVVAGLLMMLLAVLLPAAANVREAHRPASCKAQLGQITRALAMYQDDNAGWLPAWGLWSEAAWSVPKRDLWFYRICPEYMKDSGLLICPDDPFGDLYDFEAVYEGRLHTNSMVPSCGYGLNYTLRHLTAMNPMQVPPRDPARTVFLADVGPDDALVHVPIWDAPGGDPGVGLPWRDGGRIIWDDGERDWYDGPTWLSARHYGNSINVTAMDGSTRRVRVDHILLEGPILRRESCLGASGDPPDHMCGLCAGQHPHYDLSESDLWWWTGPSPTWQ